MSGRIRPIHRVVHAPVMCEIFYPMNKRLLSPKYIQPVVDRCIALTYQHLEDRADRYDGMNVPLLDFIVPLAFDAAGHAFFGKDCPLRDLFKAFKLFDDNFHLFLAGLPKMFMRGPVAALDDLATIVEEKYFSKPGAMDDASDVVKEWERIPREAGFVSHSPTHCVPSRFYRLSGRKLGKLPDFSSVSSGQFKRTRHL